MKVTDAEVEAATKAANAVRISYEDRLTSLPEGVWTAYDEKVARVALLAASQARALSSGEGWVLVPRIETDEMCEAGLEALQENLGHSAVIARDAAACWRAMVHSVARPQPPSKDNTNE